MRAPAGPAEAGSGQNRGRSGHINQALLLARHSLSWMLCVCDLTPALYAWNGLFIPQGGQRVSERQPKSLASILVILGGCCAPGRPV